MRNWLSVFCFCAALAGPVVAQEPTAIGSARAQDTEVFWNQKPAWFGWKWTDAFQTFSGSVSIYFDPTREGAPQGRPTRLRLVARQVDQHRERPDKIAWTDSDRCPALLDLAQQFQAIEPPRTVIPGLTSWPPQFAIIALDGVNWVLWSRTAQQEGRYPAYSQMSSNAGPIAEWGAAARAAMSDCWGDDQPPGSTQGAGG